MSIDILSMRRFRPNGRAILVALPVWAVECEATPPLENYLDAYEDAVLKFVSIGLSARGIAVAMNAPESLIEGILDRLAYKQYVEKESGRPWRLTEDGGKYLNGSVEERGSENSQFGYMFINAVKKEILPFFYQGDIAQIPLYRGEKLPVRLTSGGDEGKTFEKIDIKRSKLKEAYGRYMRNVEISGRYGEGEITLEEAVDLFEGLDSFDEEDTEEEPESGGQDGGGKLKKGMFIRELSRPRKQAYLTMRIILDPQYPGGYRVESPFDLNGIDNDYFLRQIQWLAAAGAAYIGGEELGAYLDQEIRKLSPAYRESEKDFSVFVLEKAPLLKIDRRFEQVYEDLARIYELMRRQDSLIEKENIVNNISRSVLESLFNAFFRPIKPETLVNVSRTALSELKSRGCQAFVQQLTQNTGLDPSRMSWNHRHIANTLGRLASTRGNSILEKFINVAVVNFFLGTGETARFLSGKDAQRMYDLTDRLNQIRRKVSHDTDDRFEEADYEFYMANVFELVNGLLEAHREE